MSVDLSGLAAVQSRMLTIQSRFAAVSGAVPSTGSTGSTDSAGTFASRLAAATADTGTGGTLGVADPASAATSATGDEVVADARRYLGVPYVWGGTDPQQGLDCSGLVQRVYADLGVDLPRVAADQARQGTPVASLAQARPGDLLAFGDPVDHIGIYAGNGQMVVAPKSGDVVKVEAVYRTPTAIRRILPDPMSPSTPSSASTGASGSSTAALAAAPAAYRDLFTAAAARHGVPASLLASVARAESAFDPSAVSHAGALGLMQLMPGTARSLGVNPLDPGQAVDGAARLLAQDLRTFGSPELALAAYNAGPDAVRRYGGVPPYAETRAYVQRVLAYQNGGVA